MRCIGRRILFSRTLICDGIYIYLFDPLLDQTKAESSYTIEKKKDKDKGKGKEKEKEGQAA